jgi:hypothetical protein
MRFSERAPSAPDRPPHEENGMPLSPHEEKVLAGLAEKLRADDPALAEALGRTPLLAFLTLAFPLSVRSLLVLLAALTGLVAVGAVFADQLGMLGMAAVTCAALVPWLVGATRSAGRGEGALVSRSLPRWIAAALRTGSARLIVGAVLILAALSLVPSGLRAVVGLVLTFVVLPFLVLRVALRPKRRDERV